jgi:lipid II:glycine glycyltransferase (peptidoglycan interpeptide bridge formation enzyme)
MIIKELKDKNQWDNFVKKMEYNSIFDAWTWGVFERYMGNNFENFAIYEKDEVMGLIPVKHVLAKRGKYLHLRHGPIFNFDNTEIWNVFLDFIKKKARDEKYWFVRMSPLILERDKNKYKDILANLQESPMHDVDGEITWVLNLRQSEEDILMNMRKNTRYYIKKAQKDGIKILKTKDPKYLEFFWEIYKDTIKRQKWSAYSKEYIEKEFDSLRSDDQIELYLASFEGKFIAGSLIEYFGNQAIYHHSGILSKYLKLPASYLIQWEAIKEAKSRNLNWYNFWGIAQVEGKDNEIKIDKAHPWAGLTFFKTGFGGQVRQFIHAKDLVINKKYYITRHFESIERWVKGYKK